MFEALGQRLIDIALDLYRDEDIGLGLKEPLYAMDSTGINWVMPFDYLAMVCDPDDAEASFRCTLDVCAAIKAANPARVKAS